MIKLEPHQLTKLYYECYDEYWALGYKSWKPFKEFLIWCEKKYNFTMHGEVQTGYVLTFNSPEHETVFRLRFSEHVL